MCTAAALLAGAAFAQQWRYPPVFPEARQETYKTAGKTKLDLWIFSPEGHTSSDRTPAIVFFFGGEWRVGSPSQFGAQCKYLAGRGMVAITADYRVTSRNGSDPEESMQDAKSAVRWVRANADRLGIDPQRIAAGGGSSGGHIAAAAGVVPGFEGKREDKQVSSVPNALVLFNAVLVNAPVASPYDYVKQGLPPTLVLHGKRDKAVPYDTAEAFCDRMRRKGNRCELAGFAGGHGFFNFGLQGGHYQESMERVDQFLVSLGWLEAKR